VPAVSAMILAASDGSAGAGASGKDNGSSRGFDARAPRG
jgi:hypothetical protein